MTLFPWADRARIRWCSDLRCCHGGVGPLRLILKHGFYDPLLASEPGPQVGKMSGRANRNALIRSSAQDCCSEDIGGSHR